MLQWLKLSQHKHSGQLRAHEHTSYFLLFVVLFLVGVPLTAFTVIAESPPPAPSSISLNGTIPGKPPTKGATIASPTDQQHFSTSPIIVSGTCPDNTLIEIYKSNIFAGSTICKDDGTYSVNVDLLYGLNTLIAKVYDALNQPGPDSAPVTVYYDLLPAQAGPITSLNLGGTQLLLNSDAVYRGVFPGQELDIPVGIVGGTAPYAINVQWGDATSKMLPRNDTVGFTVDHIFKKAGTYQINIQATDATGRVAFLSVAAIVNGQPGAATPATTTMTNDIANKLLVLWPLYVGAVAVVTSFWVGERREKRILNIRGLLLTPEQY